MKPFYKFAKGVVSPIFNWLLPVKFIGFEKVDKSGGYILCSNHTSMSDPFFIITIFKRQVNFMAKAELFRIPVVKQVLSSVGAFAVERGTGDPGSLADVIDGACRISIFLKLFYGTLENVLRILEVLGVSTLISHFVSDH